MSLYLFDCLILNFLFSRKFLNLNNVQGSSVAQKVGSSSLSFQRIRLRDFCGI